MPSLHLSHGHTISLIRHLRSMPIRKPVRKQGRVTRQAQPDALRVAYYRAIHPVCVHAREAFDEVAPEIIRLLIELRHEQGKKDSRADADRGMGAARLVDEASRSFTRKFRPDALHEVAKEFGKQTSDFQKRQLDKQVKQAIGVPYTAIEKPVRDRVEGWAAVNVDLIKTVPERYFDRLRIDVEEAFAGGTHPNTLAEEFEDAYDISENDARRIARDQIGKLNADVNQDRQESLGVTGYVWRGMNDEREREEHLEREGESFDWDDPPEDGHPGEAVQCRCYAEPDFSDIIEGLE